MSCVDYRKHEAASCYHRPRYRWRAADGCTGYACLEHIPTPTNELVELTLLAEDGLPADPKAWTCNEALANAFIGKRRL